MHFKIAWPNCTLNCKMHRHLNVEALRTAAVRGQQALARHSVHKNINPFWKKDPRPAFSFFYPKPTERWSSNQGTSNSTGSGSTPTAGCDSKKCCHQSQAAVRERARTRHRDVCREGACRDLPGRPGEQDGARVLHLNPPSRSHSHQDGEKAPKKRTKSQSFFFFFSYQLNLRWLVGRRVDPLFVKREARKRLVTYYHSNGITFLLFLCFPVTENNKRMRWF